MAKTPDEMLASMIENLKEKTGKTLEQWLKIAAATKLDKHGKLVEHLKAEYGVGHGYANLIAHSAKSSAAGMEPEGVDLVANQYAGEKAALKPVYDTLIARINAFGKDVEISPKKAYVSLRRAKQFAIIQPSTKSRVDVGINLKGAAATGRLEASGSFNAMVSHRVRVESSKDVDAELVAWLRQAYDAAG